MHLKSLSFVTFVKVGKHIFDCVVRTSDLGLPIAVMYSVDGKIFAAKKKVDGCTVRSVIRYRRSWYQDIPKLW